MDCVAYRKRDLNLGESLKRRGTSGGFGCTNSHAEISVLRLFHAKKVPGISVNGK